MVALTLETLLDGRWHRAATLDFSKEEEGASGQCFVDYDFDYLDAWLSPRRFDVALSVNLPLEFGPVARDSWPRFLDDLRPMGNARRWWLNRLRLPDDASSDFRLLRDGTVAPVGNVRIAESLPSERQVPRRFPIQAVIDREYDFIEWAADHGAQVGGATGAGGESPKLLLRRDGDEVWIDVFQDEPENAATHVLTKFPRGKSERDRVILRSEYVYYRALAALGVDTIPLTGLELHQGEHGPSLWLPRFDVRREAGREVRFGMESMYSLLDAPPGARLRHQEVLAALQKAVPEETWPDVLVEYVRRDVLNLVFGNSDNHGRNTSVLKSADRVWLAPVYDFAPMKMDPEGVTRTSQWGEFERGGDVDWLKLLPTFGEHEELVREGLRALAQKLRTLPDLLKTLGLPDETLNFPSIGLTRTEQRLEKWGLL